MLTSLIGFGGLVQPSDLAESCYEAGFATACAGNAVKRLWFNQTPKNTTQTLSGQMSGPIKVSLNTNYFSYLGRVAKNFGLGLCSAGAALSWFDYVKMYLEDANPLITPTLLTIAAIDILMQDGICKNKVGGSAPATTPAVRITGNILTAGQITNDNDNKSHLSCASCSTKVCVIERGSTVNVLGSGGGAVLCQTCTQRLNASTGRTATVGTEQTIGWKPKLEQTIRTLIVAKTLMTVIPQLAKIALKYLE